MATLPPVAGVYRAVMNYTLDGQEIANVWHFTHPEMPTPATPGDLGNSLVAWWNGQIKAKVPATLILKGITITDLSPGGAPSLEFATLLPSAGTFASPQLPNHCTLSISFRTGLRGRSFRGRTYHPGLMESNTTGNSVNPTELGLLVNSYQLLVNLDSFTLGVNYQLVIVSYYANKALRSTPVVTPVLTVSSEGIVDSQRRRLPGRGR